MEIAAINFCPLPATEQAELEDLMKEWVLRRTKAIIASQLPKKGAHNQHYGYVCDYSVHAHACMLPTRTLPWPCSLPPLLRLCLIADKRYINLEQGKDGYNLRQGDLGLMLHIP